MAILSPNVPECGASSEIRQLASSEGIGSVTLCPCSTLTLNIQALSLRLDMKAFAQLFLMCSEAMDCLEHIARQEANDAHMAASLNPATTLVH